MKIPWVNCIRTLNVLPELDAVIPYTQAQEIFFALPVDGVKRRGSEKCLISERKLYFRIELLNRGIKSAPIYPEAKSARGRWCRHVFGCDFFVFWLVATMETAWTSGRLMTQITAEVKNYGRCSKRLRPPPFPISRRLGLGKEGVLTGVSSCQSELGQLAVI